MYLCDGISHLLGTPFHENEIDHSEQKMIHKLSYINVHRSYLVNVISEYKKQT